MKNAFWKTAALLIIVSVTFLSACSKKQQPQAQETRLAQEPQSSEPKIDFDLSKMNYNMISAATFEMLVEPQKYADKTVKISGQFYSELYEGKRYYSVIVWDATQCCPAGLDFIPPESYEFPQDFPEQEAAVTVVGKMQEDTESGSLVCIASSIM